MIKTYLQVAIRNLTKDKFYSIINILGLTVGLACFLVIYLFVQHELNYDSYYPNHERIYRLAARGSFGGSDFDIAVAGAPAGMAMVADYPEVEEFIRFRTGGERLIKHDVNYYKETPVYADGNFFSFFDQKVIMGNPETALTEPNTTAISASMAERIFDTEDPIGEIFEFNDGSKYEIKAVFADIPSNTHFHFDFILSMESLPESKAAIWLSQNFQTYIRVSEGTDPNAFERKMQGMVEKYMGPEVEKFLGKSLEEFASEGNDMAFYLQPVTDIHLTSDILAEIEANNDIKYVYIFSAIALFILLIACINYMNLATAKSSGRAKEVGIRKVMGAHRPQLMIQFISESVVVALIAVILAIFVTYWSLPQFNELSGKSFDATALESPLLLGTMLLVGTLIGFLSGSYPAFFLSAFKPVSVLKGPAASGSRHSQLRNILVVFQFAISIFLIVGTLIIFDQLAFVQNKDLGFSKEHKIILHNTSSLGESVFSFKEEVLSNSNFTAATVTSYLPSPSSRSQSAVYKGNDPASGTVSMQIWTVDHDFVRTLGMNLIEGRDFSKDFATDSTAVIMNLSAVKQFGFENPLNEKLGMYTGQTREGALIQSTYEVIGDN